MEVGRRFLSIVRGFYKSQQRSLCICSKSSTSATHPLLLNLLSLPVSQIKSTLDSYDSSTLKSFESSWDTILTSLRSSSPDKARLVLEWKLERLLMDEEIDHNQYSNLVSLCAKIENLSLAMRVFSSMESRGIKPTTTVFNSLIRACLCSRSDVITALSLFEIMENSEGYKPNSQTYDTFVLGFSKLRDVGKMQAWFAAKKVAGFSPNLENYESLICACVRTKDFDSMDRFYKEMMSTGVVPNVNILEYVLEGSCKRRNCDEVKDFLYFLLECRFDITGSMIEKIVELYSELEKVDEMEKLLETLMGFDQVGEALLQLHCGLIRLYAKLDRLDDVEFSVGRMMSQGMLFRSSDDINKVISSYFRKEAFDRLDLFLKHIKRYHKLTRSTYDLLVAGYRRAGLSEELVLVVKDMELAGL